MVLGTISIDAYAMPDLLLSGPRSTFPGSTVTINASAVNHESQTTVPAAYAWEVTSKSGSTVTVVASGTTASAVFVPPDVTMYTVTFKARYLTSPVSDPRSWTTSRYQVSSMGPTKPSVRIGGPTRIEVGKTYTFTSTVVTPFALATSNLTISGYWTLPDGTTVNTPTLSWTPTSADLAAGVVKTVKYTAWVTGYEPTTTASATAVAQLTEYVFPTFTATPTLSIGYAPANLSITVTASPQAVVATLEGLTYTWTVPSTVRVLTRVGNKLTGVVDYATSDNVVLTVADSRGNSQTLTIPITVADPTPIVLTFTTANMSTWSHAPLVVGLTGKATGGHPLDAIKTWTYTLDGVPVEIPNANTARITIPTPGMHSVVAKVTTRMGATATKNIDVSVPSNVPASCSVAGTVATNRRSITLRATCTDPDGRIVNYKWFINGTPVTLSVGASWVANLPASQSWPVNVEVQTTDDGGATSTASGTFN